MDSPGSLVLYGLKHKNRYPLMDLVCDAFWNMGFDVKADYFKAVSKLSLQLCKQSDILFCCCYAEIKLCFLKSIISSTSSQLTDLLLFKVSPQVD